MVTLVTANLVNAAAGWILIFGHLGAPALGAEGAGWATCIARFYMFASLLGYVLWSDRALRRGWRDLPLRPDAQRLRALCALGLPAALQTALEVGVFAAAAAFIGRLGATSLAAHQLALNAAALTFMVPLGVSSAGAVRVGQALGRADVGAAARAGWTALLVGAGFMLCAGLAFVLFPRTILRALTTERSVIATATSLLLIAALFQLFDGVQVVATGVLRGTGETRTPMVANLVGHWALGLPIGYALCFWWAWGAVGMWIGLSVGLIVVALVLLRAWVRRVRMLASRSGAGVLETPAGATDPNGSRRLAAGSRLRATRPSAR
jgi:MATE family multidrug resistance protein